MRKSVFVSILLILISGLIGAKSLLHSGFYSSHDGEHQLVRQFVFEQGLKDGQIPVRFSRQLYNGYGYPLFVFTYRLPFYVGEIFRLSGWSFADSIKAVFFLAYIASGLAMFWFARRWGNLAGLVAAILYMWAPYRFSVMFVRAALGEHTAAIFVPLLFGSISSGKKGKINVVLGAAAIAGLFLSHAMMAQIVMLMFIPWVLTSLRRAAIPSVKGILLIFGLGLGLAAYYLVPAAAYRGLTQKLNPNYFADHFVTFKQLVYSPWGYTFSMKGVENDGMSFQVGMAQWAAVGIAAVLIVVFRLKRSLLPVRKGDSLIESIAFLVIFFLSIFLMTEKSAFIWNFWKNYINIDMPWRFLLMTTFSASALAGISFEVLKGPTLAYAKVGPLLLFVGLAIYTNRNHLRVNEYLDYPDSRLAEYRGTSNSDNEYRPKWGNEGMAGIARDEASVFADSGELKILKSKSNLLELAVRADRDIRVDINTFYFPGWKVFVDGQPAEFKYAGEGGIMRANVSAGTHLLSAKFTEPTMAKIADFISILTIAFMTINMIKLSQKVCSEEK